jgi:hypothetical protein
MQIELFKHCFPLMSTSFFISTFSLPVSEDSYDLSMQQTN